MSIQISDKSFEGFKQAYATLSAAVTKFQAQAEGAGGKVGTILTQEIYDTARQMLEAGAVLAQEATAKVADVVAEVTGAKKPAAKKAAKPAAAAKKPAAKAPAKKASVKAAKPAAKKPAAKTAAANK